jgi:hypothetical protein
MNTNIIFSKKSLLEVEDYPGELTGAAPGCSDGDIKSRPEQPLRAWP